MSGKLLVRSVCFWVALAAAVAYALMKVQVFKPGSVGSDILQAAQLVLVMMAAYFPGLRVSTSPSAAQKLATNVRRASFPPPSPGGSS